MFFCGRNKGKGSARLKSFLVDRSADHRMSEGTELTISRETITPVRTRGGVCSRSTPTKGSNQIMKVNQTKRETFGNVPLPNLQNTAFLFSLAAP